MSEKKLTALGTASQVPTRLRNQTGLFLKWDQEGFLFDVGEGTQRQMTKMGISASKITKIFISHFHGDHCLGLPGVIQRISLDQVSHVVELYYPASGQYYLDNLLDASSYQKNAQLKLIPIVCEGEIFEDDKISITTEPLDHPVDVFGFRIEEKNKRSMLPEKLNAYGIKGKTVGDLIKKGRINIGAKTIFLEDCSVEKKGLSMAYVMDTRLCENIFSLCRNVDLLVCESTYLQSEEELAKKYGHLTAYQAGVIAARSNVGKMALTHFSGRYTDSLVFEEEVKDVFQNGIILADGDILRV